MDTNYETIKSLIELLVKKAGFDVDKNYGEEELEKTRSYIFEFKQELLDDDNEDVKESIEEVIENLKKRESKWENNAEVLGKSILKSYKNGDSFKDVEENLEKLVSLALIDEKKSEDTSLMSYVYDSIKNLEEKKTAIEESLSSGEYKDSHSKKMDEDTINYLNNKIIEYEAELKNVTSELERLNSIETRDIDTTSNLKVYISNTEENLERLKQIKEETMDKEIVTEVWAKLEKASIETRKKYNNAVNTLKKFESLLEDLRKSKEEYSLRKTSIESEINKCRDIIDKVNLKIQNDKYPDYTNKVIDENENAVINTTLEELKNKKEVIYIDVNAVKKEIIKEWSKKDGIINKKIDSISKVEKEKTKKIQEKKEEVKGNKKIEFDW